MGNRAAVLLLTTLACWNAATHAGELPDRQLTPGTINAAISEEQFRAQCHAKGWTRPYRPPVSFTNSLKKLQMSKYGYPLSDIRLCQGREILDSPVQGAIWQLLDPLLGNGFDDIDPVCRCYRLHCA